MAYVSRTARARAAGPFADLDPPAHRTRVTYTDADHDLLAKYLIKLPESSWRSVKTYAEMARLVSSVRPCAPNCQSLTPSFRPAPAPHAAVVALALP